MLPPTLRVPEMLVPSSVKVSVPLPMAPSKSVLPLPRYWSARIGPAASSSPAAVRRVPNLIRVTTRRSFLGLTVVLSHRSCASIPDACCIPHSYVTWWAVASIFCNIMLVPAHLDTAAGARTYQRGYGLIRRRKVIPRDPRIGPQIDRRTAFQRARQFWGTFTDEHYVDHYTILDLLLDPEGGLSDITGLYLAKFRLLPAG